MNREWFTEAVDRLVQEAEHTREHWSAISDQINELSKAVDQGMTLLEFVELFKSHEETGKLYSESYNLLNHLFLIHGAIATMISEAWASPMIPLEVKAEVAKEQVEHATGEPQEVVRIDHLADGGMGFLVKRQDIVVPDDPSGLENE